MSGKDFCKNNDLTLRKYQVAIADWMDKHGVTDDNPTGQRGMIVQFGTGTGKTLVAVNVAEMLRQRNRVDKVYVIAPKSLVGNFKKAVTICLGRDTVPNYYKIMSYDQYKLHPPAAGQLDPRTLLIIDEVHNLRNENDRSKVIIPSATHVQHILLLTATPYINRASDIILPMRIISRPEELPDFPLNPIEFNNRYLNDIELFHTKLKNKIAVYREEGDASGKPRVTISEIQVPMSEKQIKTIQTLSANLDDETREMLNQAMRDGVLAEGGGTVNAFLNKARQISNSYNHKEISPKVVKLVDTINNQWPVVVYSEYLKQGVHLVRAQLETVYKDKITIGLLSGDLTEAQRTSTIEMYNKGKIHCLLITAAAAEGVSLVGTRQIHILEPYWNMARMIQVQGRAIRLDSHTHLPEEDRHVHVYYWLSVAPDDWRGKPDANSIYQVTIPDVALLEMAKAKQAQIVIFEQVNEKASIPLDIDDNTVKKAQQDKKELKKLDRALKSLSSSGGGGSSSSSIHNRRPVKRPRRIITSDSTINIDSDSTISIASDGTINIASHSAGGPEIDTTIPKSKSKSKSKPSKKPTPKKSKSTKKTTGPCAGKTPPCPDTCKFIRGATYTTKKNKVVVRRASCRKK